MKKPGIARLFHTTSRSEFQHSGQTLGLLDPFRHLGFRRHLAGQVLFLIDGCHRMRKAACVSPREFGHRVDTRGLEQVLVTLREPGGTHVDAGFDKSIPLEHPYMQVLKQYEDDFGGAVLTSKNARSEPSGWYSPM